MSNSGLVSAEVCLTQNVSETKLIVHRQTLRRVIVIE